MWERVGILRDADSMGRALGEFEQIAASNLSTTSRNFVTLALLVTRAAIWREESRGGHYRTDFPEASEKWQAHSIQSIGSDVSRSEKIDFSQSSGIGSS
jgi:L-aspartate oxidase